MQIAIETLLAFLVAPATIGAAIATLIIRK